jgi:hypothetical protein
VPALKLFGTVHLTLAQAPPWHRVPLGQILLQAPQFALSLHDAVSAQADFPLLTFRQIASLTMMYLGS